MIFLGLNKNHGIIFSNFAYQKFKKQKIKLILSSSSKETKFWFVYIVDFKYINNLVMFEIPELADYS